MNTPHEIFLHNIDLRNWALQIAHDDRFAAWVALAMGELANRSLNADVMYGARIALTLLAAFPEDEPVPPAFPEPGLRHDFDPNLNRKPQDPNKP